MTGGQTDIAIVGGGLAGGLTALAIHRVNPRLSVALFEAGDSFGGNHRWSWFEGDLDERGTELLGAFKKAEWSGGNEVRFPSYTRQLASNYRSLDSRDFDEGMRRALPQESIRPGSRVAGLDAAGITLDTGERIAARAVIDCRDAVPSEHLTGGWQVFLGQHLRTDAPHGLARPVIMDASVEQPDAYRFVYLLPLGHDEIFVEDTYYSDSPALDRECLRERISTYARDKGWACEVVHEETGVLPVITGGDFAAYRAELSTPGVALSGARGGFVHPLTSYTLPIAVDNALAIAEAASGDLSQLAGAVEERAQQHWSQTAYYRLLGKMLFDAALPRERYRVFERFYRLPEPLITRFYAARSSPMDKLRILTGRPPVAIGRAVKALLGKGTPLVQGTEP
ncbi:lycopene beta-cyclase CrtY [Qipengyuania vesicularis]|uniref:lycopene beta-cyclase CrtY n=1 Tax=Qipengyuania vesicularis TaxID=2867232 RepID=UPI001C88DF7D|nr:lycopene beta-cyclase CrtY [Qipengyuania vesicularis]MBX7527662.1 lycopene beta-cyclase CrtY [Qipengyuania vesicularis]